MAMVLLIYSLVSFVLFLLPELFDESDVAQQWLVGNNDKVPSVGSLPSPANLTKDPVMVINEYCQRNKFKVRVCFCAGETQQVFGGTSSQTPKDFF